MSLAGIRMWLRALLNRQRIEAEMDKEMRMHLDLERRVVAMFLRRGMAAAVGLASGLAAAVAAARGLETLVFGLTTTDPLTIGAVGLLLATVALAACYVPARSASRIDPLSALRAE